MSARLEKTGMRQNSEENMLKIGITGTIASGKTSVSILLRRRGFAVFNSDNYAKMATHKGNPCFSSLVALLSNDVVDASGDIDRKKMAEQIFHDENKRKAVNEIVHPYVKEGMSHFFENHREDAIVFAEVPLLFEANMQNEFDKIVVVTCDKETAIKRMMEDREYTEEQALARFDSQLDPEYQKSLADTVIENNGDLKQLDSLMNKYIGALRKEIRNGNQK